MLLPQLQKPIVALGVNEPVSLWCKMFFLFHFIHVISMTNLSHDITDTLQGLSHSQQFYFDIMRNELKFGFHIILTKNTIAGLKWHVIGNGQ